MTRYTSADFLVLVETLWRKLTTKFHFTADCNTMRLHRLQIGPQRGHKLHQRNSFLALTGSVVI
jgi:hypothetical protein